MFKNTNESIFLFCNWLSKKHINANYYLHLMANPIKINMYFGTKKF